jgi:hypothetical protein
MRFSVTWRALHNDILMLANAEVTQGFNDTYFTALPRKDIGSTRGIDAAALQQHELNALVLLTLTLGITTKLAGKAFVVKHDA